MTQAFNLSQLANNLNSSGQLDATDGLVNAVPVANGGTGASSASAARTNLSVPSTTGGGASGDWGINVTGTAAGLSSTLAVASGGTGATHLALNQVLLGGGASAVQSVAPGAAGNLLQSDGTTWQSATIPGGGFPSYAASTITTFNYANLFQAPSNGVITVFAVGSYKNGLQINVGDTNAVPYVIAYLGNDLNDNTWGMSYSFPIKSGSWCLIGAWSGFDAFESVICAHWAVS